jgi:hypothetical protein
MRQIYKEHLFEKNYIVSESEPNPENSFEVLFSFAALFNIRITSGEKLAQKEMIPFVSEQLGINIPKPFYRGFPETVKKLSSSELLFDQVYHYAKTYGLGLFEEAGHSLFESFLEKTAFKETTKVKDYFIITEDEARERIADIVSSLLLSSRPLNDKQYALVLEYLKDFDCDISNCASKNTAIRLLADSHNLRLIPFITMSDVIKLVDEINYRGYGNEDIKKLNLRNQDRKFITEVIDRLFDARRCDIETCSEKKAIWSGLLHHIHYQPHDELSKHFVACMRGKENISVYSQFEKALAEQDIKKAVRILKEGKSVTTILRNLNYLISRCSSQEEVDSVLESIDSNNVIVLLQLMLQYANYSSKQPKRDFIFTAHNKMKIHHETEAEAKKRKSIISEEYANAVYIGISNNLRKVLKGRLGKVYIDPAMKSMALPLQENTSQGGVGVLAKGSRIAIETGKKIRAFTYWEKVDDIDLSVIGLDDNGRQTEFSWRTMFRYQSSAIAYSGDQTRGFNGGSEYFDIDVKEFRKIHPEIKYLIFCDNVFSGMNFNNCFCKAGFMTRDIDDSGEVYEPKTVQSSFLVDCKSTFAYLFGIDLDNNEFVWLNIARQGNATVAGTTSLDYLIKYFDITSTINMYSFFEMMATELVDNPSEAEVIVSDSVVDHEENAKVIRSCDFDKVLALMNS